MKLVHASISETGGAGWDGKAKAGDQTGKEVCVRSWYSRPWNIALRCSDANIRAKASSAAVKLANSNLVGYDQSERNTLYKALKKFNFDVDAYIKSGQKTETDCSAFIYAVYCCFIPSMRSDNNAPTTSTMRIKYKDWGFSILTEFHIGELESNVKLVSGEGLLTGDIVVKEGTHTAMVTDGKTSANVSPTEIPRIDLPKYSPDVDAAISVLARDVIAGNWGRGNDRKEKLYVAIQIRVNELVK